MKWEREGPAQREGEGDLAMPNLRAKELRTAATDAEKKLWSLLCNRGLEGHEFRRQHPIGPFIADFACVESLLVVEVDGGQHNGSRGDERRTAWLNSHGWRVIRFWNNDILNNGDGICDEILRVLKDERKS
jgi:very-short-patch-repair endonuclease